MPGSRPIRFATSAGRTADPAKLLAAARKAEDLGYSAFGLADHFMLPLAPLIALQAVASATDRLRLTQIVLAEGFRHPAVLAKELATLDLFSGGRLEVGIGAGWMKEEFDQAGIRFDPASVRIERLEETVVILKGLFDEGPFTFEGRHHTVRGLEGIPKPVQRPHPPIMIGGGGPKLLAVAGRQADIVQVLPGAIGRSGSAPDPASYSSAAYAEKIDLVRAAAGPRFADIELSTLLLNVTVTDDPEGELDRWMGQFAPSLLEGPRAAAAREAMRSSPVVAIGSLDAVCDKLRATRDELGFSYFLSPVGASMESLAPVNERLAGS